MVVYAFQPDNDASVCHYYGEIMKEWDLTKFCGDYASYTQKQATVLS